MTDRQFEASEGPALDYFAALSEVEDRVFADYVVVAGVTYPRCVRAVGIARCTGHVLPGAVDCGGH